MNESQEQKVFSFITDLTETDLCLGDDPLMDLLESTEYEKIKKELENFQKQRKANRENVENYLTNKYGPTDAIVKKNNRKVTIKKWIVPFTNGDEVDINALTKELATLDKKRKDDKTRYETEFEEASKKDKPRSNDRTYSYRGNRV